MHGDIGATLREARAARGIGLEEVERITKIRGRFLAAIEEERWDALPGRAYAAGFLRTYAEFLELDPTPMVEQLWRELEPGTHEEERPPEPIVQRGTLPGGLLSRVPVRLVAAALGAAAVVALLAVAITNGGNSDRLSSSPPTAEEEPAGDPGGEEPEAEEPPDVPPEDEDEPPTNEPERVELLLDATGTVWVCLENGGGELLVAGETLIAGETRGPFEARRLRMTFGNGLVELSADGATVEVPETPDPLGFEVTADGVEELGTDERPTCT